MSFCSIFGLKTMAYACCTLWTNLTAAVVHKFIRSRGCISRNDFHGIRFAVNGIAIIGGTTDALLNFDANQTITMQVEILMLIPGVFHLDIFFEHAHRRWKTGDSCVILVETNMNDGATG